MQIAGNAKEALSGGVEMRPTFEEHLEAPHFTFDCECIGADGKVKWAETFRNTVTTVGKNSLLDNYFAGSSYTAALKLGLKAAGTAVIADTLASHASWAESTPYSGNRPALAWASASAGSKVATQVSYAINGTATVAGAFVTDQASGTSGLLYSAGDLASARSVLSGDTLNITLTVSV